MTIDTDLNIANNNTTALWNQRRRLLEHKDDARITIREAIQALERVRKALK